LLDAQTYSDGQRMPINAARAGCEARRMKIRKPPPLERDPVDEPHITTPVIDMQDLEHQSGPLPELDLSKDDERARDAIEEFEKSLKRQPPG
jgi:hypothetical protein